MNCKKLRSFTLIAAFFGLAVLVVLRGGEPPEALGQYGPLVAHEDPYPMPAELRALNLLEQNRVMAHGKSAGCLNCHKGCEDPHWDGRPAEQKRTFNLGCVDCHGGDAAAAAKEHAHVLPRFPEAWPSSRNPVRSYTLLNHESPEFVRFVNPGDLRIAHL